MPTKTVKVKAKPIQAEVVNEEPQNLNEKIEQLLGSKGYKDVEIEELYNGVLVSVEGKKSGNIFKFQVKFKVEESHFCCGSIELGEIEIKDEIKHLTKELKEELIRKLLSNCFDEAHETDAYDGVRMLYFTVPINGEEDEEDYEKYELFANGAIKEGFNHVATFTNSNSGNILEHYIKYE